MKKYLFKHPISDYCYIANNKEKHQKDNPSETCIGTIEVEEEKIEKSSASKQKVDEIDQLRRNSGAMYFVGYDKGNEVGRIYINDLAGCIAVPELLKDLATIKFNKEEKKMVTKEIKCPVMITTKMGMEIATSNYIPINAKNVKIVYEVEE